MYYLQEESWLGIFPKFHQSTAQAKKKGQGDITSLGVF